MVDVYHEFAHPYEMTEKMVEALKPGGRLVFVEFRLEDDEGADQAGAQDERAAGDQGDGAVPGDGAREDASGRCRGSTSSSSPEGQK